MYQAAETRYQGMSYAKCGKSGLKLPAVSFGLWHNFGSNAAYDRMKELVFTAFDLGITHFDLANNYGPVPGSAEENFGRILKNEMAAYRDEMIISTKAGYDMWDGPYGTGGSRKYLTASLDQSLKRMGLDYVDIFYHHCMDPETPLEESMGALASIVKSGKALYAGISNYDGETMEKAADLLESYHCPFIINQNRYSIFDRSIEENGLKAAAKQREKGDHCIQPAGTGNAYGPLSEWHTGRQPDPDRRKIPERKCSDRRADSPDPCLERTGIPERTDPFTDGLELGIKRQRSDKRSCRSIQTVSAYGKCRSGQQNAVF